MRNGFVFRGRHTSAFEGVTVKTRDRPIFPSVKEATASAAEMDGEYDFTEATGHEHYNTRNFQIDFFVVADGLSELQKRLTALSRWFRGRGTLIFDDLPMVEWDVRVIDSVSYMPEHGGGKALLSVTYKAQPFSESIFSVPEGPRLDDTVPLDTHIPLDMHDFVTLQGSGIYTDIPNVGDVFVRPILSVTGAVAPFAVGCNGKTLIISDSGDFVIDCEKEIVTKNGISIMQKVTGDFFELKPGCENDLVFDNAISLGIAYTPQFIYDAVFAEDAWGDGPEKVTLQGGTQHVT